LAAFDDEVFASIAEKSNLSWPWKKSVMMSGAAGILSATAARSYRRILVTEGIRRQRFELAI
jgi:hypothetical protein